MMDMIGTVLNAMVLGMFMNVATVSGCTTAAAHERTPTRKFLPAVCVG